MEELDPALPQILEISCDYCDASLERTNEWESHFEADRQYAICSCDCGKKKWVPVGLAGFDPRNFFEKQSVNVESSFPKVFEKE